MQGLVHAVALLAFVAFAVLAPSLKAKLVYGTWLVVAVVLQFGVGGQVPGIVGLVLETVLAIVLLLHYKYNRWN